MKDSTNGGEIPDLLKAIGGLLQAHRTAFHQEWPYRRATGLFSAELFSFARHTVSQELLTLGVTNEDWSAWYRLFSRPRYDEAVLAQCLLKETLKHVTEEEPYCVAIDSTSVHRSNLRLPGTSWLRDSRFSAFRPRDPSCATVCARRLADPDGERL